ncbi:MAG: phosphatidate cytidylyltransferase [Bacteroidia bacterium]|nr:phosphatidate cytidylyltransferase [Bacteroidia bacterium]
MHRQRVLTALGAGVALWALLYFAQKIGFLIAWFLTGTLLLAEWSRGEKISLVRRLFLWGCIYLMWLSYISPYFLKASLLGFTGLGLLGLVRSNPQRATLWQNQLLYGLLIMGVGWGTVGWELIEPYSIRRTLAFLSISWMADTSAYVFGRWLGRARILPHISPNKTWEGLIGSIGATGVWGYWAVPWVGGFEGVPGVVVGAFSAVVAFLGDAYQSAWKRTHGMKDSGALLPGHGGIWDRVDSLLWIAPLWYFLS